MRSQDGSRGQPRVASSFPGGKHVQLRRKFVRMSHLRKLCECEQVAAVCYRIRNDDVEFLLVQTGGGRWTFPKGGVEPGLTHAQAAALEAFEEAGVHGRMEEAAFARYRLGKPTGTRAVSMQSSMQGTPRGAAIHAHLCEVKRLSPPQEPGRNRTWFSAEKAKRRLNEDRPRSDGAEFARVVERAVARIRQVHSAPEPTHERGLCMGGLTQAIAKDGLQRVPFEASEIPGPRATVRAAAVRYVRGRAGRGAAIELGVNAFLREELRLEPPGANEDEHPGAGRRWLAAHSPNSETDCAPVVEIDNGRTSSGPERKGP